MKLLLAVVAASSISVSAFSTQGQLHVANWHSSKVSSSKPYYNSDRLKRSQLNNVPLEDALEVELDEMELELDLAKPKDEVSGSRSPRPFRLTDASAIIAGTAIGGGFLALPSVTTPIGYLPTALGLSAAWIFLLFSAFSFVESAGLVADLRSQSEGDKEEGAISVATVLRYAFGKKLALVGGFGFILQMAAVVTAQVVKGAELINHLTGLPYILGCIIPPALAAMFVFGVNHEVVDGANTGLTAMMILGFGALIVGALTSGNIGTGASLFARSDWTRLMPNMKSAWAMPVFINLLCFGQSMPLVVERMVESAQVVGGGEEETPVNGSNNNEKRNAALIKSRSAAFLGSVVPFGLCLCWAAIATALVSPTSTNPLFSLLSRGPAIRLPVCLLSIGAIGTTLFGSFLAMGHFASDIVCMKLGYCSKLYMNVCNSVTVAIPAILACVGPSIYLPLLSFAGAYPTTILHGLTPAVAALVLRKKIKNYESGAIPTPSIVPGGKKTLIGVSAAAIGMVGASTALAVRHFLRAVFI